MLPQKEAFWIAQLLRRAGFGASPAELARYQKLGYGATLEQLLHPERVDNTALESLLAKQLLDPTNPYAIKKWWIYRMLYTASPLEEKLTLFWHGHFATSLQKVGDPRAMLEQNKLFRRLAFGNFETLLLAVSKDPAMIIYLDNQENQKGKPNENYAREVMELFSLGIGHYTERDIKEAARAFTGWHTNAKRSAFVFDEKQHDTGEKTVFGMTGNFNGDDIVHTLARSRDTARYLAKKLIKFFVYDEPDRLFIDNVAEQYLVNGYQIRPMLKAIFSDKIFFSSQTYHAKIKSPPELVIGAIKTLGIRNADIDLPGIIASMGQNIFEPPSVKGWDGGKAWISTESMIERFNFATKISSQKFEELKPYMLPSQLASRQGLKTPRDAVDYFLEILVDGDVPEYTRARLVKYMETDLEGKPTHGVKSDQILDAKLRGLVHLIMSLPTYQLA